MSPPVDEHGLIVEQRIGHVIDLILASEWRTGKTVPELAAKWGVGRVRVYEYVTEANRRIRSEVVARQAMRIESTLQEIADKGKQGAMPGDLSAATQATGLLVKIAGWDQPMVAAPDQQQTTPTVKIEFVAPERPKAEDAGNG